MPLSSYKDDNMGYWSKRAPSYSDVNRAELRSNQRSVWGALLDEQLMEAFPGRNRGCIRVLDVGTGPGFFAILLCGLGYSVSAADYTASMLGEARINAGVLAERIDFRQMDAESLSYPDASFDAVISRNLTWNLKRPERAYAEWVRVLRPGGLLLNFDANWYRYLYDEAALAAHEADRLNVMSTGAEDDMAGTDVDAMEAIARRAPLSRLDRPGWDLIQLRGLGMAARADTEIWRRVWTRDELINNASTPMFMLRAVKASRV